MECCKTICKQSADTIKEGVIRTLNRAGINLHSVPGLAAVLDIDAHPFKSVDTN